MFDSNIDLNISLETESCFIYTTQGFTKSDYECAATVQKTNVKGPLHLFIYLFIYCKTMIFTLLSSLQVLSVRKPPDYETQKEKK